MDQMVRGLVSTPMETLDQFITGEVTNHLFEDKRIPFSGVDLIALNIKRARDHGKHFRLHASVYFKFAHLRRNTIVQQLQSVM